MDHFSNVTTCDDNITGSSEGTEIVITVNISAEEALNNYKKELFQESLVEIIVFTIFLVIGGCGNLFVIYKLCSRKYRNSQMSYLLRHLTLADLTVIFITITIEIVWRFTITWTAGELCCKIVLTMRTFGLYLSSLMLICISVDRYFAFVYPLSFKTVKERNCRILIAAYLLSLLLSLPQAFIYHIEYHPIYKGFSQCMSENYFDGKWKERLYNVISLCGMYFIPLLVIVYCYTTIIVTLHRNGIVLNESEENHVCNDHLSNRNHLMSRAKRRTLKVGLIITLAFIVCWSPYVLVVLWFQFDEKSARNAPQLIRNLFFLFAVSSSVVNPFVHSRHLFTELRVSLSTNVTTVDTAVQKFASTKVLREATQV